MRLSAAFMALPLALVTLAGCEGSAFTYEGASIPANFPLDLERAWEFTRCTLDTESGETIGGEPYTFYGADGCPDTSTLQVLKDPETRRQGGAEIVTLNYSLVEGVGEDAVATPAYSIDWSSGGDGVQVHGWTDATSEETVSFDKPVLFGKNQMNVGETVSTTTAGITFTSTFVEELGDCPNNYNTAFDECLHISIEAEDGTAPFVGDWWIGATFGPTAFKPADEAAVWVLDYACAREDCPETGEEE